MKKIIAPFLVFFLMVIVGVTWKLMQPKVADLQQKGRTDASKTKGKIRIAIDKWDTWFGYSILKSPEFKNAMRRYGWIIVIKDDNPDYRSRMKSLHDGECEFAVATVDSYILNAKPFEYKNTSIVMIIDESAGDAIIANKNVVGKLDDLKGKSVRIAFLSDSPSHHLLKAAKHDFSIPELIPTRSNMVEVDGSPSALKALAKGKTDVAVLWEPEVTKALKDPNNTKLLGSDETEKLIVDILIGNSSWVQKNPDVAELFLREYFKVLKKYQDDENLFFNYAKKETGLSRDDDVRAVIKGVRFTNFSENCEKWFGIDTGSVAYPEDGLAQTIDSTVNILKYSGDFKRNPLPNEDAYILTNRSYLAEVAKKGFAVAGVVSMSSSAGKILFSSLSNSSWNRLEEKVTINIDINFQAGSSQLDLIAKNAVDKVAKKLEHYPNFRVEIRGHTGTRGDKAMNLKLSQERADAVLQYYDVVHGIEPNRFRAKGYGGLKPLKRKQDESKRSWEYRLPRVEFVLLTEKL